MKRLKEKEKRQRRKARKEMRLPEAGVVGDGEAFEGERCVGTVQAT